ncbi:MAG: thermonuclease family protein [Nitrospira sp.]|nr:thermonuclease family protein [Nitrospira sp.]
MRVPLWLILLLLLSHLPSSALAQDFTGHVVGVMDGDTIEVLRNKKAVRVRLQGIDCPEKSQAFGNRAKLATSDLVFAKNVTIESHGQDKYKRTLGTVFLSDGTHVNRELVAEGWCWWYQKYAPEDVILAALEVAARLAHKGLWADPHPVPPWEWRKRPKG